MKFSWIFVKVHKFLKQLKITKEKTNILIKDYRFDIYFHDLVNEKFVVSETLFGKRIIILRNINYK